MSHSGVRTRYGALLLTLAIPYLFASVASDYFHQHDDPTSLTDPDCPACLWQKVVQDAPADPNTMALEPVPLPICPQQPVGTDQIQWVIVHPTIRVPRAPPLPL